MTAAAPATRLLCSGCGAEALEDDPLPFRCRRAGTDGADHILRRVLTGTLDLPSVFADPEPNPFIRYRHLLHSYTTARRRGMSDGDFVALVRQLDDAVAAVDGHGFAETPLISVPDGTRPGVLLVKNETGNVSGSHKARHLFGLLLWLEVAKATRLLGDRPLRLAIASCGNAALGAATVARAASRPLDVFVPTDAHPAVVKRLRDLGASANVCERDPHVPGDPCMHAFRAALATGAIPFGVQGNENGLTLEGGLTLGWEIASALLRTKTTADRIFIQVGGGALASSCIQALEECVAAGVLERMPIVHAVQTRGAYPLARAFERVLGLIHERHLTVAEALAHAAAHRSEFMWPWESVPHSIAHGILDDETYDWLAVVEGMLRSGGSPVIVSEGELTEANRIARDLAHVHADHTGSAGLAGYVQLRDEVRPSENVLVLLTGRER